MAFWIQIFSALGHIFKLTILKKRNKNQEIRSLRFYSSTIQCTKMQVITTPCSFSNSPKFSKKSSRNFSCKSKKGLTFLKKHQFNRYNDYLFSKNTNSTDTTITNSQLIINVFVFHKLTRNVKNTIKELKPSMLTENSSSLNLNYMLGWSYLILFISKHFVFLNEYQRRISQKNLFQNLFNFCALKEQSTNIETLQLKQF